MTIADSNNRWPHVGDGVSKVFSIDGAIFSPADVKAYIGAELKTLGVDYTVSINPDRTAAVTFMVAPAAGADVLLTREVAATQTRSFPRLSAFPAEQVAEGFDKLTVLIQQQQAATARRLGVSETDAMNNFTLPAMPERGGRLFGFDADGELAVSTKTMAEIEAGADEAVAQTAIAVAAANTATSQAGIATASAVSIMSLVKNVKAFGAIGNGIADDTAAFSAALATAGTIEVPSGTYRLGSTLSGAAGSILAAPANTTINMAPDAVLWLDNVAITSGILLDLGGSNITLRGGRLRGPWDLANNGTNAVTTKAVTGLRIRPLGVGSPQSIAGILVDGVQFERWQGRALLAGTNTAATLRDLTVRQCRFFENFGHLQVTSSDTVPMSGIRITDNWFGSSASPAATTKNASLGGNAISIVNKISDVAITGNIVADAGRMAIEVWADGSAVDNGHFASNIVIRENHFGTSTYRTMSLGGVNLQVLDNVVIGTSQGWDYVELSGDRVKFSRNRVQAAGVSFAGAGQTSASYYPHSCEITDNTIIDVLDSQGGEVSVKGASNTEISRNRLVMSYAVKAGWPTSSPLSLLGCRNVQVRDNRIEMTAPCNRDAPFSFNLWQGGSFSGNTMVFSGYANNQLYAAGFFGGIEGVEVSGNRAFSDTAFTVDNSFTAIVVAGYNHLWQYKHDGSGFVVTAANTAILNDPPGSPVNGTIYVVGDTPTGAWSSNPRSFAVWNGSSWSYTAILGLHLYNTNSLRGLVGDAGNLPKAGSSGDAYLLTSAGLIGCSFSANDFSAGRRITAANDSGAPINFGALGQSFQLCWNTEFRRNIGKVLVRPDNVTLDSSSVELLPALAPPSAGYHLKGMRLTNLRPAAGGYAAWLCTTTGTPGTWKGAGLIES